MDQEYTTIRAELAAYLGGEITLSDLYYWFMEETWDMDPADPEYDVYCHVALWFAEYTTWWNGQRGRTEEDLRVLFAGIID